MVRADGIILKPAPPRKLPSYVPQLFVELKALMDQVKELRSRPPRSVDELLAMLKALQSMRPRTLSALGGWSTASHVEVSHF